MALTKVIAGIWEHGSEARNTQSDDQTPATFSPKQIHFKVKFKFQQVQQVK